MTLLAEISKLKELIVLKGGPGSGHHGHKGRPGKRGGGLPRGASGGQLELPGLSDKKTDLASKKTRKPRKLRIGTTVEVTYGNVVKRGKILASKMKSPYRVGLEEQIPSPEELFYQVRTEDGDTAFWPKSYVRKV